VSHRSLLAERHPPITHIRRLSGRTPKLRTGSFFPELLEPRGRIDKPLWAVITTAYITGTSTRKVDDLVKALGCDTGVSKSSVWRICNGIDDDVAVLRNRRLDHQPFVYRVCPDFG
jgi:putative transposase